MMGGEVSLKLPFTLMHTCNDLEHTSETLTRIATQVAQLSKDDQIQTNNKLDSEGDIKPEKDGT